MYAEKMLQGANLQKKDWNLATTFSLATWFLVGWRLKAGDIEQASIPD